MLSLTGIPGAQPTGGRAQERQGALGLREVLGALQECGFNRTSDERKAGGRLPSTPACLRRGEQNLPEGRTHSEPQNKQKR